MLPKFSKMILFFSFFFEKSLLPHSADHLKEDLSVNQKQQESEINITKIIKEKPHITTTENGGEKCTEIFLILIFKKPQFNLEYG
jgi:hypothetical protein